MLAYIFVVVALAVRFMPHPWTFTPVVASLLFFGARGRRRRIWIPWVLLAASDLGLVRGNFVVGNEAAREHQAAACDRGGSGQFGFFLPDQQLRRVGRDEFISQDLCGPDDVLYVGFAVLPECS